MKPILSKDSANQEYYKMQGFVIFVFIVKVTFADEKREIVCQNKRILPSRQTAIYNSLSPLNYTPFPPAACAASAGDTRHL